jgi:DUF177 domain-containing protein
MPENTHGHLDPRAPLVVSTRELPRRPGEIRPVTREVPAPPELGLPMIAVPVGAPVALDLHMESASEGVFFSGTVSVPVEGECARCLRPIGDSVVARIAELFAYPGSTTEETTDADEVRRLDDELADLEPVVRDAVVLELPANPVCRPDCPGLCPECGTALDDLPPDHSHARVDPRWSALGSLLGPGSLLEPGQAGEADPGGR